MSFYLSSGYLDVEAIIKLNKPFTFVVGGRGSGKTYGALKYVREHKQKFVFLRRTQSQLDIINKPDFSPFKPLNEDGVFDTVSKTVSKYNVAFYDAETGDDGKKVPAGAPVGYSMALSTMSNLRGFDASDVEIMIFDEFIPERHERPIKNEGAAFANAYETINRNRELKGRPPLRALCLANSNELANPLFLEFGLVSVAERMQRKQQTLYLNDERGIAIIMLPDSPISKRKRNTALYKATENTGFSDMALGNKFDEISDNSIGSRKLIEYLPYVNVGEIFIYKHKSNGEFYVTTHASGNVRTFRMDDTDRARFQRSYYVLWDMYMRNRIVFENSTCEVLFQKAFE